MKTKGSKLPSAILNGRIRRRYSRKSSEIFFPETNLRQARQMAFLVKEGVLVCYSLALRKLEVASQQWRGAVCPVWIDGSAHVSHDHRRIFGF